MQQATTQANQSSSSEEADQVLPNNTIYINNINEKIKVPTLKKQLYTMFSQFGEILDIIASRYEKTRGQAWIVFKDVATATAAKKKYDGFIFHDKPFRINFAKTKSDATAALEGNLEEHKRKRTEEKRTKLGMEPETKKTKKTKSDTSKPSSKIEENQVPNNILFIENLPKDIEKSSELVETLFSNYDGFKRLKLVGEKGVGFVEYETVEQATAAKEALQFWKIKQQPMRISFKK
ncbi:hypothetical protein C9374_013923 [Naegleria lovaniensis]|uniref:RRM domain-containing protein n=1 Tax=Naegleria lovaniensis TaxID=51637 RepID=A0AA88KPE6_NAELO|nr:uncharacterized protein C9374_013923 [Naegleria lovaniensis]KAG2389363.1 hypothetical protein C9374_013923 [Naegleria lovaniensis]